MILFHIYWIGALLLLCLFIGTRFWQYKHNEKPVRISLIELMMLLILWPWVLIMPVALAMSEIEV